MVAEVDEKLIGAKWAYGIMGGFLFGMLIVTAMVLWDSGHRSDLEKIMQPTAVGDSIGIQFDPKQNPAREILRYRSEPYFLQSNEVLKYPEYNATKLATADDGKTWLYRPKNETDSKSVLVKIAPNAFLRLTTH